MVRPTTKRSVVWDVFNKPVNGSVTCKKCNAKLKYFNNTSNLHDHIKRKHADQLPQVDVQENTVSKPDSVPTEHEPQKKKLKQLKLVASSSNISITDNEIKHHDSCLVRMIALDFQPISIVEDEGFRQYSHSLNPNYTLPSRKNLSDVLIPEKFTFVQSKLTDMLNATDYVSATTDLWTSSSNKSYITVTGHFIFDFKQYSVVLGTNELTTAHTGENIAEAIMNIFQNYNIADKIVTIVTDNGSNMKKAVSEYLKKYNHFCVAHTLNLSVQETVSGSKEFQPILVQCRSLVSHFKRSSTAMYKLREAQKQLNLPPLVLIQDVSTRWNSELMMLERLLEVKVPLSVALASLTNAPKNLEAEEWVIVKEAVAVLKPLHAITEKLSGELYPTMSLCVPLIRGLQRTIKKKDTSTVVATQLKLSLLDVINRRLGGVLESNKHVGKAVFLDPRFKKDGFGNEDTGKSIQTLLTEELTAAMTSSTTEQITDVVVEPQPSCSTDSIDDFWEDFDSKIASKRSKVTISTTATIMIREYLEMPVFDRKEDPLKFWKNHNCTFKELYKLACKYLSIPATSVPSERIFSLTGLLTKDRRNRLGSEKLNQIVFLNRNLKVFE